MSTKKYRPYLTADEIKMLASKLDPSLPEELTVLRAFRLFQLKMDTGFVNAALDLVEKKTIEQKLGFAPTTSISLEERREKAYQKYKTDPAACNSQELEDVNSFLLLHGTEQEKQSIEQNLFEYIMKVK